MNLRAVIPQLRTTDLADSLRFYEKLGFDVLFRHQDFYAAVRRGGCTLHLKRVDETDPSIDYVSRNGHLHLYFDVADADAAAAELGKKGFRFIKPVHDTAWGTREFVVADDQGHTLYFGMPK